MLTGSAILNCPVCREGFSHVDALPDIAADPDGLFAALDADGDGALCRSELHDVLDAHCPLRDVDAAVKTLWPSLERDGRVCADALPKLWAFVKQARRPPLPERPKSRLPVAAAGNAPPPVGQPPSLLHAHKAAWFVFFDCERTGLCLDDVARAIAVSENLPADRARTARECVEAVWPLFVDAGGSGVVTLPDFVREDGLGDVIIASAIRVVG